MDFEWNEAKGRSNIRKHGLDFADAEEMFRGCGGGRARHTGRLRGKAMGWARPDSRSHHARGFRGARTGHDSHHLA